MAQMSTSGAHAEDLALARAVVAGDVTAIAALEVGPFAAARAHLRARKFADWIVDEAMQQTRVALLVVDDGPPGIGRYAGTGSLAAFVRVVAVRFALKATPDHADEAVVDLLDGTVPTPELATLKATYGAVVRDAVLAAWRALPRHDRFVLSLDLHGRMSLESIAALYGIHKVSAARKLARSRDVLLGEVRGRLREHLGGSLDTVDSVLRLITFPISPSDLAPATGVG
jgi:RNA polymerase sigma-70 factor, ECF subfamily